MCHGVNKIQKNWKLGTGTVELRNYSETMDRDYGIPKLLRNYSETVGLGPWNSEIIPKLLRNYSETMGLGPWPWNSENCGLL